MPQKYYMERKKTMKVKVIKDCYFDKEYIKAGRIIDFSGDKLPSWATLADGNIRNNKKEKTVETSTKNINNAKQENPKTTDKSENADKNKKSQELTDTQKEQYLEMLINEGMENNIFIENADKKTIDEQISELENLLKKEQ